MPRVAGRKYPASRTKVVYVQGTAPVRRARRTRPAPAVRKAYSGTGFYKSFGRDLGSALGSGFGPIGRKVGGMLGEWGSSVTGFGGYHINKNSLLLPSPPSIRNAKELEGATIVNHREYICDIKSSIDFQVQADVPLNPGLATSFPWLSPIAGQFTQWRMNGCIVQYVASSGNAIASTNNALGTLIMATNYDSASPPFVNKQQMLNQEFSSSAVPSCDSMHPIECAPNQTSVVNLYTRTDAVPVGTDIRLYDLGRLQVATQGQQTDGTVLGSLWITYEIILLKPQLTEALGEHPTAHYSLGALAGSPSGIFDNVSRLEKYDNIGVEFDPNATTIHLPAGTVGKYMVMIDYGTSGGVGSNAPLSLTGVNISYPVSVFGGTGFTVPLDQAGALDANGFHNYYIFQVEESSLPSSLTFTSSSLPVNTQAGDFWLVQLDYDVL